MGREDAMRRLMDGLGDGPAVVFVAGEAGIGKSRLLHEAEHLIAANGTPVLRGACHPLREPLPFGPAIEALRDGRSHFGPEARFGPGATVLAPLVPELADRFPDPGPNPEDGPRTQLLIRAVHEVLGALGPAVLMVEDLHWADEATRDLLLLLARNPPEHLRLVLTYRPNDVPGSGNVLGSPYRRPVGVGGTEIVLGPLSEDDVRDLAASVIGPAATGPLCRELFERSGGLPLAAEEDLLVLARRITPAGDGGAPPELVEDTRVPRALQEAVNSRIEPLDPAATAVVQAAAVLAVPVSEELLSELATLTEDQVEEALIAVLDADVLVEKANGRYGFRHVLARRAVYDRISAPRRRRLHARAVEVLSAQQAPALVQIAHHTRRLGDTAAWLPRAQAAADHATAVGDDGVAAELLGQLLAEPTLPPDDRARCALALSTIAVYRADPVTSIATLRGILADPALATTVRGEIRFNLGRIVANTDPHQDSQVELEQSVVELAARPELAAVAMATLSIHSSLGARGGSIAENLARMEQAVQLVAHSDDPVSRADVLANHITLLELVGDPRGRELLAQLPRRSTDRRILRHCARALHNAAYDEMARGCDQEARVLLGQAEELGERTDNQITQVSCRLIRLQLDLAGGLWADLDRRIEAMLQETANDSNLQVELLVPKATLDTARGRWARARASLEPIAAAVNADIAPEAITLLARLDLLEGDTQGAWHRTEPLVAGRRSKELWSRPVDLVPTVVRTALACGRHGEAQNLTDEAERGIRGLNAPGVAAGVDWCRGMLADDAGNDDAALADLGRARVQYEAIGRIPTAARVAEDIGRLRLAHHPDRPGTARELQDALDVFSRLGATADAARCEQALRDSGRLRPAARGRRSYGTDLSPREHQVAELLATGAGNKDIAHALSLSPRTVEHHVANTLRKLGVTRGHVRDALDSAG
ncbi:ATP-binding protein [Streptomyces sp. NRRL B-24484]|uniref:ATP-binding protein n=1 Tax=Streptomyces sp. NRRL B-24484 TaxID=1463833 RepID=UPI0004C0BAFC|nr:LuxR family transcriptional regulator [Streptomyces sp. NRRL B-24484]